MQAYVAVIEAAKIRFRPRVMISASHHRGFIPLALNIEEGGDMLQPMAAGIPADSQLEHW